MIHGWEKISSKDKTVVKLATKAARKTYPDPVMDTIEHAESQMGQDDCKSTNYRMEILFKTKDPTPELVKVKHTLQVSEKYPDASLAGDC
ncbi:hypothetical protein DPMN_002364 [Dreissena polymorpha]|uniref:Uncharacterized protein n=1 Tax=Dreissena polymorpha TaxID=45954 RepID=A0A9D4ML58_DREPO|nr:hypothetical protein DPMN_002364 [Dreissena polymorpha]